MARQTTEQDEYFVEEVVPRSRRHDEKRQKIVLYLTMALGAVILAGGITLRYTVYADAFTSEWTPADVSGEATGKGTDSKATAREAKEGEFVPPSSSFAQFFRDVPKPSLEGGEYQSDTGTYTDGRTYQGEEVYGVAAPEPSPSASPDSPYAIAPVVPSVVPEIELPSVKLETAPKLDTDAADQLIKSVDRASADDALSRVQLPEGVLTDPIAPGMPLYPRKSLSSVPGFPGPVSAKGSRSATVRSLTEADRQKSAGEVTRGDATSPAGGRAGSKNEVITTVPTPIPPSGQPIAPVAGQPAPGGPGEPKPAPAPPAEKP